MLLLPVALPIEFLSMQASQSKPFLNIGLQFDPHKISELALKIYPQGIPEAKGNTGLVSNTDKSMINAVNRLIMCLPEDRDTEYIAPLVWDEILIRVLHSPIGSQIVKIGFTDHNIQGVIKVISWLCENFSQQVKIADLAKIAHMGDSSFHERFKTVTSMTPLQYQKSLRLHEARRLMVSEFLEAMEACRLVGYASESQFSRDYSRLFGNPPKRDTMKLRQQPLFPF